MYDKLVQATATGVIYDHVLARDETESGTRPGHCPTVPSVNASRKPATVASATQDPPSR